jgi:hypothetical protein
VLDDGALDCDEEAEDEVDGAGELLAADDLDEGADDDDCAALLLADEDCVGVAEPPEEVEFAVVFIVKVGLADMMLDRMLER